MRIFIYIFLLIPIFCFSQKTEKIDIEGCLVEQALIDTLCARIDRIDAKQLEIDRCSGVFNNSSDRTGNRFTVPNSTVNIGWTYTDWARLGSSAITSPDCINDLQIVAHLGNRYWIYRRSLIYTYYDVRLLINGTPVVTRVADIYDYDSRRTQSEIPPNDIHIKSIGTVTFHRDNVPAGSTVEVEFRMRYQFAGMQASGNARIVWAGIRSEASFSFSPNDYITDVRLLSTGDYWIRGDESGYEYGIGEKPIDAKVLQSEDEFNKTVLELEKNFDENLEKQFAIENEGESGFIIDLKNLTRVEILEKYEDQDFIKKFAEDNGVATNGNINAIVNRLIAWAKK